MSQLLHNLRALLMLLCFAVCSCANKDLVVPGSGEYVLSVVFDWQDAPGAEPEGMSVIFFPQYPGGRIWRFEIAGRDGGNVAVPAGIYSVLAFNNDTQGVEYANTLSFEEYSAYTAPVNSANERLRRTPDMLWRASSGHVEVSPCGVDYESACGSKHCSYGVVRLRPVQAVCTYTCMALGLKGYKEAWAVLSSLASAERLATGQLLEPSISVPFSMVQTHDGLSGKFLTFGNIPGGTNRLQLFLAQSDSVGCYSFDVTSQVVNAPDPLNVLITIDCSDLPPASPADTSAVAPPTIVGVEGWNDIIINL